MKKFLLLFAIVASLTFVLVPVADAAGAQHGAVAGRVLDASGNPVAGAVVDIDVNRHSNHPYHARTHTDRRGRFEFRRVPVGNGKLEARKRGVGRGAIRGAVVAGQTVRARIVLQ